MSRARNAPGRPSRPPLCRLIALGAPMLLVSACGHAGPPPNRALNAVHDTLVIIGATVVNVMEGRLSEGMVLTAIDGVLVDILPDGSHPNSSNVLDAEGRFVIPGLVDSHVHLATLPNRINAEARLYRQLYAGVTAVRDMAGDGRALADLARAARLDEMAAPDIYYSALMAGPDYMARDSRNQAVTRGETPGAVPWNQSITPRTEIDIAVALARGTHATGIKLYQELADSEVQAIVREAKRQGMRVWSHIGMGGRPWATPLEIVDAGVEVVSHSVLPAVTGRPGPNIRIPDPSDPVFDTLFSHMVRQGTIWDVTWSMNGDPTPPPEDMPPELVRFHEAFHPLNRAIIRRAHEMGVPISTGTDYVTPRSDPYPALHKEVEALVEIGLSPTEALRSATWIGARVLGIEETHGVVEVGRTANLVLLDADPTIDVAALRRVFAVVKNGTVFLRENFDPERASRRGEP